MTLLSARLHIFAETNMNYKQCAQYLSDLGITISRNKNLTKSRWTTSTPKGEVTHFNALKEARDYWSLEAKKAVHQLLVFRSLLEEAESLDAKSQLEFQEWIDGCRESAPTALARNSAGFGTSTTTWAFEARKLTSLHGSIANADIGVLLKQARQERLKALSLTKDGLNDERLDQQCRRRHRK